MNDVSLHVDDPEKAEEEAKGSSILGILVVDVFEYAVCRITPHRDDARRDEDHEYTAQHLLGA